ncbi:MAG: sugar phosphate isomerase/epimerase [Verrucomicrobiales bacterium]|jgi:sugar phosphate isomerase/epimerase|nr:sugar phosphate isomerase/epimerase [Verrucomicrobiales bacterium]
MSDGVNGKIDLAFCWVFKETEPKQGLQKLKSCGFEGIELWPDAIKQYGIATWKQALTETGMRCFQLCPYFNFMGGETTIGASRVMLDEYLTYARELDCKRLRVFTGPPWGEGVVSGRDATKRQWKDSIESLTEFCDKAANDEVELCLECHEGSLMEDGPLALRLIHGVNRKNLTANLQVPLLNETWEESVRLLGPYTTHIHIHNWPGEIGGSNPITYLEAGRFDWRPVLDKLCNEQGQHLCLSVEHGDHYGVDDPWETARRDGAFLQQLCRQI